MEFRTELKIPESNFKINHQTKLMAIGSCFVENIGNRLKEYKFNINFNPYGIIFNPHSIAKILSNTINDELNFNTQFVEQNNFFYSYDFHSKFNGTSANELVDKIISTNKKTSQSLLKADVLMLTFGTAWIYKHIPSNQIVANCHKVPQKEFNKSLLDLDELKILYQSIFKSLLSQHSNLKIILTVSPVRHLKDGLIENNQSKSILLLLCKFLADAFPNHVIYFPSYELVMDDLRDYRFFNSDMLHPNQQAIDYIFEKFSHTYFEKTTLKLLSKIKQLNQLKGHVFLNATNEQINNHHLKIKQLETELFEMNIK
jgi:hypothetical protein